MGLATVNMTAKKQKKSDEARETLKWVALFLGELRDGLTMINMQSAYLIASKSYTEKQAGILFFVFGMSQFIFQTPAGYLMDYTNNKTLWLSTAAVVTTVMTVVTAVWAEDYGTNLSLMIFVKFLQGSVTALIPPGLNSITQGIVGAVGMTKQVSRNEMMNHMGTALIVLLGSLLAYGLYPNIALLFVISPVFCFGVLFFLCRIKPEHIDHDAARGLVTSASPDADASQASPSPYTPPSLDADGDKLEDSLHGNIPSRTRKKNIQTKPSFNFGWGQASVDHDNNPLQADTPLHVLRDPTLLTFTLICFLFHTANGCVLPLVMQSLALQGGRSSMLLSGLCIIVAQTLMVASAKICGDFSHKTGRKKLFLIGLFSVSIRCLILTALITLRDTNGSSLILQCLILSTQILDGIGAGVFGTMYILVTSDISAGTGRFSFTLGVTTAAMNIGGTVSGYLGEALAQDFGYRQAFVILGIMSLLPALLYLFKMPETLPQYSNANNIKNVTSMASIAEEHNEDDSDKHKSTDTHQYHAVV